MESFGLCRDFVPLSLYGVEPLPFYGGWLIFFPFGDFQKTAGSA